MVVSFLRKFYYLKKSNSYSIEDQISRRVAISIKGYNSFFLMDRKLSDKKPLYLVPSGAEKAPGAENQKKARLHMQ